jgi:Protein of unknown function (DUF1566)
MRNKSTFLFVYAIAAFAMDQSLVYADERCGLVTKKGEEPVSRRFEILAEHNGRAFVDMRTCLVWDLSPWLKDELTLDRAMEVCSHLGQGGYGGEMSWQIPTMAELTSLDSESWNKQKQEFAEFKLPVIQRNESYYWTVTPWLGNPNSQAAVAFSSRTTIVNPLKQDAKAAVWCVRGYPATGLR